LKFCPIHNIGKYPTTQFYRIFKGELTITFMQLHGFLDPGGPFIFIVITGGYIVTVFRSDRCKDWTPWSMQTNFLVLI